MSSSSNTFCFFGHMYIFASFGILSKMKRIVYINLGVFLFPFQNKKMWFIHSDLWFSFFAEEIGLSNAPESKSGQQQSKVFDIDLPSAWKRQPLGFKKKLLKNSGQDLSTQISDRTSIHSDSDSLLWLWSCGNYFKCLLFHKWSACRWFEPLKSF